MNEHVHITKRCESLRVQIKARMPWLLLHRLPRHIQISVWKKILQKIKCIMDIYICAILYKLWPRAPGPTVGKFQVLAHAEKWRRQPFMNTCHFRWIMLKSFANHVSKTTKTQNRGNPVLHVQMLQTILKTFCKNCDAHHEKTVEHYTILSGKSIILFLVHAETNGDTNLLWKHVISDGQCLNMLKSFQIMFEKKPKRKTGGIRFSMFKCRKQFWRPSARIVMLTMRKHWKIQFWVTNPSSYL